MIESPVLREPGTQGVFEPNTSSVGLPFQITEDLAGLLSPTVDNWRQAHQVMHELVHFYQFYATSWGLLHQVLGRTQFLLLSGFLREYADADSTVKLPLLEAGESMAALPDNDQEDPRALLRFVFLLERLRRHVFGYEPAPADVLPDDEVQWLVEVLYEGFGLPKLTVSRRPAETAVVDHGYRIDDLLESHAHALSSLWMFQAVERHGLADEIRQAVLRVGNRFAAGPYGTLLGFARRLPVAEHMQLSMFCTICDVALNLVDPRWVLGLGANPATFHVVSEEVFDPVANSLRLLSGTIDGAYPTLGTPGTIDSLVGSYLDDLASIAGTPAHLSQGAPGLDEILTSPLVGMLRSRRDQELLNTVALDTVGSYGAAGRARREHQPLLLGGVMIEDLAVLLAAIGLPNILSTVGPAPTGVHPAFRVLTGLSVLDGRQHHDGPSPGWQAAKEDVEVVSTMRDLLVMTRDEIARAGEVFGTGSLPPPAILASWWGLHIDDFE